MELAAVVQHFLNARHMFFDDDDENDGGNELAKVENFAEETVPNFNDEQFKRHFRLYPDTFEHLFRNFYPLYYEDKDPTYNEVQFDKQLMILIWYLGNTERFRQIADRFGISVSTAHAIVLRVSRYSLEYNERKHIIAWPSHNKCVEMANRFQDDFPGIIGAIDGSHIRILKPGGPDGNAYINRKSYPSLVLQGICDHDKLFIDVYVGECGSNHDEYVFKKSDIYQRIMSGTLNIDENFHIIGDLAYKLRPFLIVGYKALANRTARQVQFNTILSQRRIVIENAFGLLKGRWRRLRMFDNLRHDGDEIDDNEAQYELRNPDNVVVNEILDDENDIAAALKRENLLNIVVPE